MKIRIKVTSNDIEHGRRCDPDCCPVGRALNRAGVAHFGVAGASVVILDERRCAALLPLPAQVMDWILEFDGRRPVEPFDFELDVPVQPGTRARNGHRSNGGAGTPPARRDCTPKRRLSPARS